MKNIGSYKKITIYFVIIFAFMNTACLFFIDSNHPQDGCSKAYTEEGGKNCFALLAINQLLEYQENQIKSTPDKFEPNDSLNDAMCITEEYRTIEPTLHSTSDIDFFKWNVVSTLDSYEIGGRYGNTSSVVIRLFDQDGVNLLAKKPIHSNAKISYKFDSMGIYYLSFSESLDPTFYYFDMQGPLGPCN